MGALPPELLILVPLALAAGVDLYLTLLLIGAAPTIGLWASPMPGALGDLDSPGVLIMVGTFYVLEFAAERFPPTALVWNAFHAIIRPVSGSLLALLLLDGQPLPVVVGGAAAGAALASLAHGIRTGGSVVRWLRPGAAPSILLVSFAEDVIVMGTVSLALDAPAWALGLSVALLLLLSPTSPSHVRAFVYAVGLVAGRVFATLRQRRWRGAEELPDWVTRALENNDVESPGGALRGSSVGALRLSGAPTFAIGWVVVRGGDPVFVFRRRRPVCIDLGRREATAVSENEWLRRVDLEDVSGPACILFGVSGPSVESLRAEFLIT